MKAIREDFRSDLDPRWYRSVTGSGSLEFRGSVLRLVNHHTTTGLYTNAQIDDHHSLARCRLPWFPPLRIAVRARFSHAAGTLTGTAGFGVWNDPFGMSGGRLPALPKAIWFFYASPPTNLKLAVDTPGCGWKAATINASSPSALTLLPIAPLVVPLMHLQSLYRRLWPAVQRAMRISETLIEVDMTDWHTYLIDWGTERAVFEVDGAMVLNCPTPTNGRLGFVMWMDNQYAIVTPWGRIGAGRLQNSGSQWMEVDTLAITLT